MIAYYAIIMQPSIVPHADMGKFSSNIFWINPEDAEKAKGSTSSIGDEFVQNRHDFFNEFLQSFLCTFDLLPLQHRRD